jgi:hypothetical protein
LLFSCISHTFQCFPLIIIFLHLLFSLCGPLRNIR